MCFLVCFFIDSFTPTVFVPCNIYNILWILITQLPAIWTVCLGKGDEGVELVALVEQVELVVRWCNSNSHLLLLVVLYDAAVVVAVVVVVGVGVDRVSSWQS